MSALRANRPLSRLFRVRMAAVAAVAACMVLPAQAQSLDELLFAMITLGDDRLIEQVRIAGQTPA